MYRLSSTAFSTIAGNDTGNLDIVTFARVTDGADASGKATGVEYVKGNEVFSARTGRSDCQPRV